MSSWLQETPKGVILKIVLQPRASKIEIVGPHGEPPRLKIRISAPPVEGEANDALVQFLKKRLGIPAAQIEIVRGQASRQKDILCSGMTAAEILARLSG